MFCKTLYHEYDLVNNIIKLAKYGLKFFKR